MHFFNLLIGIISFPLRDRVLVLNNKQIIGGICGYFGSVGKLSFVPVLSLCFKTRLQAHKEAHQLGDGPWTLLLTQKKKRYGA